MKKVCLLCVYLILVVWSAQAQNRQIRFEESKVWKEILEKAKKENKFVFVDFYTSWCVPCKNLADSVFTQDEVADYFNKTFICAHFDVEKDKDGKELFYKNEMQAVPTLGFFDPATGELLHVAVGFGKKDWLMEQAKLAQDPQNSVGAMTKRFKNGERDEVFMDKYMKMLEERDMNSQKNAVIAEYLYDLPEEQFVGQESWRKITGSLQNPLDKTFQRVVTEREKFYNLIGQENVDNYLSAILSGTVDELTGSLLGGQDRTSKSMELDAVEAYLKSLDYFIVPGILVNLEVAKYRNKGDFNGMLKCMQEAIDTKLFKNGEMRLFLIDNLDAFVLCTDTTIINQVLEWIDREFKAADDYLYQANLLHVKADLLEAMGKTDLEERVKEQEDMYLNRAKKKSGVHIMRAFKSFQKNQEGERVM